MIMVDSRTIHDRILKSNQSEDRKRFLPTQMELRDQIAKTYERWTELKKFSGKTKKFIPIVNLNGMLDCALKKVSENMVSENSIRELTENRVEMKEKLPYEPYEKKKSFKFY